MLIDGFDLEILTPPCEPGAERHFARATLRVDISEVLPFLNAVLKGASLTPAAHALTWERDGHKIAFHAREIDVSGIESREWAEQAIAEMVELVNDTWERREEITPSYETVRPLTPMEVFGHLPQTNCGLCGEATCFNFALKLTTSQKALADCPPLFEPEYVEGLAALRAAIDASGR